jgi:hypothetical protein
VLIQRSCGPGRITVHGRAIGGSEQSRPAGDRRERRAAGAARMFRAARQAARLIEPGRLDRSGPGEVVLLWRDEHSEAWLNLWWQPRDTGYQDHSGSCVGVHVIEGYARNEPLTIGEPRRREPVMGRPARASETGVRRKGPHPASRGSRLRGVRATRPTSPRPHGSLPALYIPTRPPRQRAGAKVRHCPDQRPVTGTCRRRAVDTLPGAGPIDGGVRVDRVPFRRRSRARDFAYPDGARGRR